MLRIYDTISPTSKPLEIKAIINTTSPNDGISKIAWSTVDKEVLYVGRKNSSLEAWDLRQPPSAGAAATSGTLPDSANCIVMDFEANANHNLILAAAGTKVYALQRDTLALVKTFAMPSPMTFSAEGGVALNPDGKTFFAGGSDLWLREFDFESGEVLRTIKGHHGPVRCVRYHPNGQVIASGSEDGTIRLWDLSYVAPVTSTA